MTHGWRWTRALVFCLVTMAAGATVGHSQGVGQSWSSVTVLPLVQGDSIDRLRLKELTRGAEPGALLLRSASTLIGPSSSAGGRFAVRAVAPQFYVVHNSGLPFSVNDGAVWAGRGGSGRILAGLQVRAPLMQVVIAPEFVWSQNQYFLLRDTLLFPAPPLPAGRSPFTFPYYTGAYTIDLPMRFGDRPIRRIDPGQSSLVLTLPRVSIGIASENLWWGPGVRNALLLSSNAAGFPHFLVATPHPISTKLSPAEAKWLVGGLTESGFFDSDSTNNLRSLSAAALTLQTAWNPNLAFGVARVVYSRASGWSNVPGHFLDVLRSTSGTVADASGQTTRSSVRDQIFSFFSRWILPENGFEAYLEWARTGRPRSLRDFLLAPNHTQGYTLGLQWYDPPSPDLGAVRVQGEVTTVERSATFRNRPTGSFYVSQLAIQGYTQRGEPLGASIGPGASTQWLALDWVAPRWRAGTMAGRIRWNEDAHLGANFPRTVGDCNHDVTLFAGLRGAALTGVGSFNAELTLGNRFNAFFQANVGCPSANNRRDIRNRTMSISWSPLSARF